MLRALSILLVTLAFAATSAQASSCCSKTSQPAVRRVNLQATAIVAPSTVFDGPVLSAGDGSAGTSCCPCSVKLGKCRCCAAGTGLGVDLKHSMAWSQFSLPLHESPGWRPLTRGLEPTIPPPARS